MLPPLRPARFLIKGQPPKKDEIIRIIMNEPPLYERTAFDRWEWTENGEFEWRYMDDKFLVDQDDLKKEIDQTAFRGRSEEIITRLINFRKVFLIIPTGSVVTSHGVYM